MCRPFLFITIITYHVTSIFTPRDRNITIANMVEIHEFCKIIQGDNVALLINGKTIITSVTTFFRNYRYNYFYII